MFGFGKKTPEEQAAEDLANKLADNTPDDEQDGLYPETPQLGTFGEIAAADVQGDGFVTRKDKA